MNTIAVVLLLVGLAATCRGDRSEEGFKNAYVSGHYERTLDVIECGEGCPSNSSEPQCGKLINPNFEDSDCEGKDDKVAYVGQYKMFENPCDMWEESCELWNYDTLKENKGRFCRFVPVDSSECEKHKNDCNRRIRNDCV